METDRLRKIITLWTPVMLTKPQVSRPRPRSPKPRPRPQTPSQGHSHMLPQHWHCQTTHNVYINIYEALNSSTRNLFNNGEQSLNCYSMMGNRS